ncbi:MAG TPA: S-methyl-5-thioribose-1-phosphate isomerase [Tepidisphaeraceae bacterium]|nr:S-methyl-5-thioribose-1-phosphate isomerase [Tepidisphaeraceae bacterium]
MLKPITWTGSAVRLLDQTRLPRETVYVDITDEKQMHDAIRRLVVRGAPAIGVSAAFGAYLGVRNFADDDAPRFFARLKEVCDYLATSRPTAVNLFWALDRVQCVARESAGDRVAASPACHVVRDLQDAILNEANVMLEEDVRDCRAIGEHGLRLLAELCAPRPDASAPMRILTHCNAGGLATAGYGTALAPIYLGVEQGRQFHVFADETRPLLQGSRITAYELKENGVPVTVICDNMAAVVLGQKKVDAVIVGADRIAANGDTANKIGTLGVAIAARHFRVPFIVAAPMSTVDFATATGREIPIEERAAEEVSAFGERPTAPEGVNVYNPAFDVTPAELITAIVTEKGVARPPMGAPLRELAVR